MKQTLKKQALIGKIVIACVSTCLAVASVYLTQPIFAEIGTAFQIPLNQARLSFSFVSIAYALSFFFLGPLSDYYEARKMASTGIALAAFCLSLAAFSPGYGVFLCMMLLLGIAAASTPAAMFALMPRIALQSQVGTFFGLIIMASVIGITLGRSGMGMLTANVGLKTALLITASLLLCMSIIIRFLPKEKIQHGMQRPKTIRIAFLNTLEFLRDPGLLLLFSTGFLLFFAYLGVVTFLTFYLLQPPFSYDSAKIGSVSLMGLSAVFGAPLSGRLISKTGPRPIALGGLSLAACAIISLGCATNTGLVIIGLFLIFFGVFSCQPAILVLIAKRVENDRKGAASSMYLLICLVAGSLSSILLGPIWINYGWAGVIALALMTIILGAVTLTTECYLKLKERHSEPIKFRS